MLTWIWFATCLLFCFDQLFGSVTTVDNNSISIDLRLKWLSEWGPNRSVSERAREREKDWSLTIIRWYSLPQWTNNTIYILTIRKLDLKQTLINTHTNTHPPDWYGNEGTFPSHWYGNGIYARQFKHSKGESQIRNANRMDQYRIWNDKQNHLCRPAQTIEIKTMQ